MRSPRTVRDFAPAKVNLTLHVTGRRGDGYHLLDSLVAFADVGDWVEVTEAAVASLTVDGPMAGAVPTTPDNLVLRALALASVTAAVRLEKQLPVAAGIGGGSSDAAAVLRAAAELAGHDVPDNSAVLGADVPVCLVARAARMRGVGERVEPVASFPVLPAVLVNPGRAVATADVFRALERRDGAPMPDALPRLSTPDEAVAFLAAQRNDLESPARRLAPEIGRVLDLLGAAPGVRLARMSGSGATCWAICDSQTAATTLAADLAAAHPHWWVRAVRLS